MPFRDHCTQDARLQGVASAIFTTVRDANVNVIMISQASSEHSVCFAVKQSEAADATAALNSRCAFPCCAHPLQAGCVGVLLTPCKHCQMSMLLAQADHFRLHPSAHCQATLEHAEVHRFGEAIRAGRISKVEQISNCCVLAAVGHQMASRKGVAATMFSALAKANINIRSALKPLLIWCHWCL